MHVFIGTKMIKAVPLSRGEYNDYRGWPRPADEDHTDAGYLVEYPDGVSNHPNHDGYISWSPKKLFDDAYLDLGLIEGRLPHQQRVIGEHAQLKKKCDDLQTFLDTPFFSSLGSTEQFRLKQQHLAMLDYLTILDQRIEAFE